MAPHKKPIGFHLSECWGDWLGLPRGTPLWKKVKKLAEDTLDGVRLMIKFEIVEQKPALYQKFLDRVILAKDLGLDVHVCTDWHNLAGGPGSYHESLWFPATANKMRKDCEKILKDTDPWCFQVCNEPFYRQSGNPRLLEAEYAGYVKDHIIGMKDAGWEGLLLADIPYLKTYSNGQVRNPDDSWVWMTDSTNPKNVPVMTWDWCAESSHGWIFGPGPYNPGTRTSCMVHEMTSLAWLQQVANGAWWFKANPNRIGANWPVFHDEVSPVGKEVHINTPLGADMTSWLLSHFKAKRTPITWLSLGGGNPWWGAPPSQTGWSINTDIINSLGQLSLGGKEVVEFMSNGTGSNAPGRRAACRMIKRVQKLSNADDAAKDSKVKRYFQTWFDAWK